MAYDATRESQDFVIATGKWNTLEHFVEVAFSELALDWRQHVNIDSSLYRPTDIRIGLGDSSMAKSKLGWKSTVAMEEIVKLMIQAELARN